MPGNGNFMEAGSYCLKVVGPRLRRWLVSVVAYAWLQASLFGATVPPSFVWASKIDGSGNGYSMGTADRFGNVYVTGWFSGTASFGTTNLTSAGDDDIYVAKYNSTGVLQWAKRA